MSIKSIYLKISLVVFILTSLCKAVLAFKKEEYKQQQNDKQGKDYGRRRKSGVVKVIVVVVYEVLQKIDVFVGIVAEDSENLAENLEGVDNLHKKYEEGCGSYHGDGYLRNHFKGGGTVKPCTFVQMTGHACKSCGKKHHAEAAVFPYVNQNYHHHGKARIEKSHGIKAETVEKSVNGTVIVKKKLPHGNQRCNGNHYGNKQRASEKARNAFERIKEQGDKKRNQHKKRYCDYRKYTRILESKKEGFVCKEFKVVIESHEGIADKKAFYKADYVRYHVKHGYT